MLFNSNHDRGLDELREQLRRARAMTPDLISKTIDRACPRFALLNQATKPARINRLIEAQAWTEMALALVELELPQWRLRRLVYEEGAWFCSLSKPWNVPEWLADSADAGHEVLPLAILGALVEARQEAKQNAEPSPRRARSSVPQSPMNSGTPAEAICCDNFT
jgi:hypothetical protein